MSTRGEEKVNKTLTSSFYMQFERNVSMENKRRIITDKDGTIRYFDKNGVELFEGDTIKYHEESDTLFELYRTDDGRLGTDATNPSWIESGRAFSCEWGIYPLESAEMFDIVKVDAEVIKE